ncbi:diacylglycerol/polyprenol kinase family protein [Halovenus salina]|uniref:Diacylglycerol/polyprenol kinase family protein n=1 Tax=Halovenus salina TaxID=1510225 RepID=A0ABD5W0P6_9EURY|nr:dolichol kinase [Halovenus salina]
MDRVDVRTVLFRDEIARRLVHASGSVLPLAYLADLTTWPQTQALFVVGATVALALEALRHTGRIDWRIYDYLIREYEADNVAAYALYMLSSAVVVVAFEPQIAVPAVFMLTVGDSLSGLVAGDEFRRVKRPRALAVMFAVSAALAAPFHPETPLAVLLGAAGATVADGYKPVIRTYVIDDNLTIPPVGAAAMAVGIELTALV